LQKRADLKELYVLYSSPNIHRVIKKNVMGGARSISVLKRGAYRVLFENLRERDHFEDL
jgi:hypothetical protein